MLIEIIGVGTLTVIFILMIFAIFYILHIEIIEPNKRRKEMQEFFKYTDKEMKMKIWYSFKDYLAGLLATLWILLLALSFIGFIGCIVITLLNLK